MSRPRPILGTPFDIASMGDPRGRTLMMSEGFTPLIFLSVKQCKPAARFD